MTDKRTELLATYGDCLVCGSPRRMAQEQHLGPNGSISTVGRLVCTADHTHSQDPADLAIIEGRG